MTEQQFMRAAEIVKDEALKVLARVHNSTPETITALVLAGHEKVAAQFAKLVEIGTAQAFAVLDA